MAAPWDRIYRGVAWASALGLVAWSCATLADLGLALELPVALVGCLIVFVGIGRGAFEAAHMPEDVVGLLAAPWAAGVVLSTIGTLLLAAVGVGRWSVAILVFASLVSWVVVAGRWRSIRVARGEAAGLRGVFLASASSNALASESLLLAALLRIAVSGSRYLVAVSGRQVEFTQYPDLLWHLAMVKDGVFRGLPISHYPLVSGLDRQAYHPGFDTLVATIFKDTGTLSDQRYFGIVLPLAFVTLGLALFAASRTWARSHRAGWIAVGFLTVTFAGMALPQVAIDLVGRLGASPLRHFLYNPPSLLGACAVLVTVMAVASLSEESQTGTLVLAAVVAAGSVALKANAALAACPAFAALVITGVIKRRISMRSALAALIAAVIVGVAALGFVAGEGGGIGVQFGAYGRYLRESGGLRFAGVLQRELAQLLGRAGPAGDSLFMLWYVVIGMAGWRLLVAAAAAPWALRSERNPVRGRPYVALYLAYFLVAIALVAVTLVQHDPWTTLAWNIAGHTVQQAWWVSLVVAAVLLDAALPVRLLPKVAPLLRLVLAAALLVGVLWLGVRGMTTARQTGSAVLDSGVATILQDLSGDTPVGAVVAQRFDTEEGAWVSGLGGRFAYLERNGSPGASRGQGPARLTILRRLYTTDSATEARDIAAQEHIDYALVRDDEAPGLWAASTLVRESDGWALVRIGR